jgi:hypothetical protein
MRRNIFYIEIRIFQLFAKLNQILKWGYVDANVINSVQQTACLYLT